MTVKTSISLTDQQYHFLKSLVEEGRAASISALIQQAVEAQRAKDEEHKAYIDGLRDLINQRAEGSFIDLEEMRRRVEAKERALEG